MFQFSELVTLAISLLTLAYLLSNWRRIHSIATLRPLVGPLVLMVASWLCTVAEGLFLKEAPAHYIIFYQESVGLETRGGIPAQIFNLLEHITAGAAGVWLLVAILEIHKQRREATG